MEFLELTPFSFGDRIGRASNWRGLNGLMVQDRRTRSGSVGINNHMKPTAPGILYNEWKGMVVRRNQ